MKSAFNRKIKMRIIMELDIKSLIGEATAYD